MAILFDPWVVKPNGLNILKASSPITINFTGRIVDVFKCTFRIDGQIDPEIKCIMKLAPHSYEVQNTLGKLLHDAKGLLDGQFPNYKFSDRLKKVIDPFEAGSYYCLDVPLTPAGFTVCDVWTPFTEFAASVTPETLKNFSGCKVALQMKIRGIEVVERQSFPRVKLKFTIQEIVLTSSEFLA